MGTIPAAQYLRRSTEHQQYSLENQAAAIENYAAAHGFVVTRTYEDTGKSGLRLYGRVALKQLLQEVLSGELPCKAILVYDVSRWGRFQDIDEAAHYEFLCRSAGIPVIYCAEPFPNDTSLPSMILKALKRMMAGEYSRELSTKVYAGAKRLAELGFRQGGVAGYGYERMLVSPTREPKQILLPGQRKSIQQDRVILPPSRSGAALPPARCRRSRSGGNGSRFWRVGRLTTIRLQLFQPQLQLLDLPLQLLRLTSKLHAMQLGQQQLQMLDLALTRL